MNLIGKKIPAFKLQDEKGGVIDSSLFRGQWTVLYAYPKDSTPGCTQESCDFRDAWSRLKRMKVQVIGISRDSHTSHQKFQDKFDLPFTLLSDPEAKLLKPLGAFGKKMMYGKETQGIIRSTFIVDPKGVIRSVWTKVSVKGHVEEVIEQVRALI
ncbi:MAG: peroxiredoxin [Holophagaceae bacterium]